MPEPHTRATVLVVDDTPVNLRLLVGMLSGCGYKLRIAESGPQALESVHANPPDLILLDIMMPGMDGYAVCKQLKSDLSTRDIPIIFISALFETADKIRALTAGGVDYITKPFHPEEVLARVETHLALRGLQRQLQLANRELEQANNNLEQRVAERTAELVALNAAYERFVPREFLGLLLQDTVTRVSLGDHAQMNMTVLIAGIRDYRAIVEKQSPREAFEFINEYLSQIGPPVRLHHGFIDQYEGAGIKALFPRTPDDAVEAAIDMCAALDGLNRSLSDPGQTRVQIGIGIHSSPLMLGTIGEDLRMTVTVIGDAVTMAARLQERSRLYGALILVSGQTIDGLVAPARYHYRLLDRINLHGEHEPFLVSEIIDAHPAPMRELMVETAPDLVQGLELCHARSFAEACVHFNRILERNPDDQAARRHLHRAARAMAHGLSGQQDARSHSESGYDEEIESFRL